MAAAGGRGGGENALWCLLFEGHQFYHEDPALMTTSKPNGVPRAPSPNTIILGFRASTYKFGREKIRSIAEVSEYNIALYL